MAPPGRPAADPRGTGSGNAARGRPADRLDRTDRLAVLGELERAGVFARRGAVPVVAGAFGTSRSTLYALLAELRAEGERA
ncbi:helix-turn-helix domain-containing protein [Streptomyces sp. NPDC008238]